MIQGTIYQIQVCFLNGMVLEPELQRGKKEVHLFKSVLSKPQRGRRYLQYMYLTKDLISKYVKNSYKSNWKSKQSHGEKSWMPQKRYANDQLWKMFNIIAHQRKANSNPNVILLHTTRMIQTKKIDNTNFWWGGGITGIPIHRSWEYKLIPPLCKNTYKHPLKLNMHMSCDPNNFVPRYYTILNVFAKRTWMFIATLRTIVPTWKQPKCPSIVKWIYQLWNINAIDSNHQWEWKRSITTHNDADDSHK